MVPETRVLQAADDGDLIILASTAFTRKNLYQADFFCAKAATAFSAS